MLASLTRLASDPMLPTPVGTIIERADDEDAAGDGDQRGGKPALTVGDDGEGDAEKTRDCAVDAGAGAAEDAAGHDGGGDDGERHRDRDARDRLLGRRFLDGAGGALDDRPRRDPRLR